MNVNADDPPTILNRFVRDEAGAVTIDWVALCMGVLMLGMAVVFSIYETGVDPVIGMINSELSPAPAAFPLPDAPSF